VSSFLVKFSEVSFKLRDLPRNRNHMRHNWQTGSSTSRPPTYLRYSNNHKTRDPHHQPYSIHLLPAESLSSQVSLVSTITTSNLKIQQALLHLSDKLSGPLQKPSTALEARSLNEQAAGQDEQKRSNDQATHDIRQTVFLSHLSTTKV
jgi:hypothetical protein